MMTTVKDYSRDLIAEVQSLILKFFNKEISEQELQDEMELATEKFIATIKERIIG